MVTGSQQVKYAPSDMPQSVRNSVMNASSMSRHSTRYDPSGDHYADIARDRREQKARAQLLKSPKSVSMNDNRQPVETLSPRTGRASRGSFITQVDSPTAKRIGTRSTVMGNMVHTSNLNRTQKLFILVTELIFMSNFIDNSLVM